MAWTVRKPRFEVRESREGGWYWELINDGKTVAQSLGEHVAKNEILDLVRFLKYHAGEVPIIGDDVLEP